jgi:hypothetical protein
MPQGLSGVTTTTNKHFLLDAGVAYANIDLVALADGTASDPFGDAIAASGVINLGAFRGGATFSPGRTLRTMPVDGAIGNLKGFVRRQNSVPTVTVNLVEITVQNLQNALAGAVSSTAGLFTKLVGGEITDAAYFTNIALATTFTGAANEPLVLVIKNALVVETPDIALTDEDETVIAVTFAGHIDPATPNTEVWEIYHPGVDAT